MTESGLPIPAGFCAFMRQGSPYRVTPVHRVRWGAPAVPASTRDAFARPPIMIGGAPLAPYASGAPFCQVATSIFRGRSSARFGMCTLSTPSLRLASIFPVSSSPLNEKVRR